MKKFLSYLMLLSILVGSLFALSGCGKDSYIDVSSVDELYAMKSNKSYQLTCDIDLQEREWYPLEVKKFNGNGYTISNCYINQTIGAYDSGFFTKLTRLNDLVFENIQMNISFTDSEHTGKVGIAWETTWCDNIAGIAVGTVQESIENTVVRNSQAIYNIGVNCDKDVRLGGIVGSGEISNSKIEDCSIICNIMSKSCSVYVGGLTGSTNKTVHINNNKVINTQIECISLSPVYCGGIAGRNILSNVDISNCVVSGCQINLKTTSSYASFAGGIIGYSSKDAEINNCASINNNIKLDSSSEYSIGGVAGTAQGKISNCLSDSNILEGITSSIDSKLYARVGGLCGSTAATISKSVAQNNKITGTNSTQSNNMFAAGFIASATASVVNCAVYNNTVNGGNRDTFTSKNEDLLFNCCTAGIGQTYPNVNNLPNIADENWKGVIKTLSLDEELWTFESGYLNLKIAE